MTRPGHDAASAAEWDERYATSGGGGPLWSGAANGTLVAEVAGLAPGTVLDVGCGEGGDAVWLARQGWRVTGLEPSAVALARARGAADAAGVEVVWVQAGLLDPDGATGTHDLVVAMYPALRHTDDDAPLAVLLAAVAPGGTLLVVHHDVGPDHRDHGDGHRDGDDEGGGFDPAEYVMPSDVAAALVGSHGWVVEVDVRRPRPDPPPDAEHVDDVVLRARRTVDGTG